jgi:hypothetical protein
MIEILVIFGDTPMSEDYVVDLIAVRGAFVEERRRIARDAIELGRANRSSLPSISIAVGIKGIQEHIDAVDVAIADEKKAREAVSAAAA